MVCVKQIAFPVVNEENVAKEGIIAVIFDTAPGVEGVDSFLGDGHVGES